MLDQCTNEERWNGVNGLIERWLQERQEMIVQFCAVSGADDDAPQTKQSKQDVEKFCQILVDYVSSGHFEVYYQLIREAEEFEDGSADVAKALLPQIIASTEAAMEFNDKYTDDNSDQADLKKNISKLGEILEARFELEDQLISIMHESHRAQEA